MMRSKSRLMEVYGLITDRQATKEIRAKEAMVPREHALGATGKFCYNARHATAVVAVGEPAFKGGSPVTWASKRRRYIHPQCSCLHDPSMTTIYRRCVHAAIHYAICYMLCYMLCARPAAAPYDAANLSLKTSNINVLPRKSLRCVNKAADILTCSSQPYSISNQASSSIQNVGPVFELIISSTSAAILLSLTSLLAPPFTPSFNRIARCDNNILCMLIGPLAEKLVSPDRGTGVPPQDADGMP